MTPTMPKTQESALALHISSKTPSSGRCDGGCFESRASAALRAPASPPPPGGILYTSVRPPVPLAAMVAHAIDARDATHKIKPALLLLGGANPRGDTIAFTTASLTWNGAPGLGILGGNPLRAAPAAVVARGATENEGLRHRHRLHVCLLDRSRGNRGASYWSGDRDLRGFVETCARERLPVIVRAGPFCHGADAKRRPARAPAVRQAFSGALNYLLYLAYVKRLYGEIGRQLEGLYFKDGGPIIGIQLRKRAPPCLWHRGRRVHGRERSRCRRGQTGSSRRAP